MNLFHIGQARAILKMEKLREQSFDPGFDEQEANAWDKMLLEAKETVSLFNARRAVCSVQNPRKETHCCEVHPCGWCWECRRIPG